MSVIHLTKNDFENLVLKSDKPVLIDFSATWCDPCRMVAPIIEKIANENSQYSICKVDVDEEPELSQMFGVSSIPMLVVIKNGKVTSQAVGLRPEESILAMFKE